jgi:hypothetical protein
MKNKKEEKLLEFKKKIKILNTPAKIQDFINNIPVNFELDGVDTCKSPLRVLQENNCHCIEGAFFAAACIWLNKIGISRPLVIDMRGEKGDWDHIITIFKINNCFGAISKTNHAVLRYREPVYSSVRELIMSYFHEYTDDKGIGKKTLREYSNLVDLSIFGKEWITSSEDLWEIHDYLDRVKHYKILSRKQIRNLRKCDKIEVAMGELREFDKKKAQVGKNTLNKWKVENV